MNEENKTRGRALPPAPPASDRPLYQARPPVEGRAPEQAADPVADTAPPPPSPEAAASPALPPLDPAEVLALRERCQKEGGRYAVRILLGGRARAEWVREQQGREPFEGPFLRVAHGWASLWQHKAHAGVVGARVVAEFGKFGPCSAEVVDLFPGHPLDTPIGPPDEPPVDLYPEDHPPASPVFPRDRKRLTLIEGGREDHASKPPSDRYLARLIFTPDRFGGDGEPITRFADHPAPGPCFAFTKDDKLAPGWHLSPDPETARLFATPDAARRVGRILRERLATLLGIDVRAIDLAVVVESDPFSPNPPTFPAPPQSPTPPTPLFPPDPSPEELGRIVRDEWIAWAHEQPNPKPSWLAPWEALDEPDKEVDRRIGWRLFHLGANFGVPSPALARAHALVFGVDTATPGADHAAAVTLARPPDGPGDTPDAFTVVDVRPLPRPGDPRGPGGPKSERGSKGHEKNESDPGEPGILGGLPGAGQGSPAGAAGGFDPVNKARHYNTHPSGVECVDLAEGIPFNTGNALKYLWRVGQKGPALEDGRKALWYLRRERDRILARAAACHPRAPRPVEVPRRFQRIAAEVLRHESPGPLPALLTAIAINVSGDATALGLLASIVEAHLMIAHGYQPEGGRS